MCASEIWTIPGHVLWLSGFHLYFWRAELSFACEDWKTTKQLLFLAGGGGAVSKPQLNMASL